MHRPGVPSRKLVQMSDRSGVGAPTHDGADPDLPGQEDASDDAGSPTPPADTAGSSVRRRGRDLFGAMLGAEPADVGTPPGVPDLASGADPTEAPIATSDVEASPANGETRARRRLITRATAAEAATSPAPAAVFDEAPAVIDSSMDSGVVVEAPVEAPRRSRRGNLRARRVHRIIRRVDPWSVLKLSLIFYFCVWAMVVVSGVLIWGVAVSSGTIENVEGFIERLLSFEEFTFNADQIFRLFAMGGLIMVFLSTAITAILAVLFNLISDLIGGIRITVVEEESTRRIVSSD